MTHNRSIFNSSKPIIIFVIIVFLNLSCTPEEETSIPVPSPGQLAWQNAEFGVIFHFDISLWHKAAPEELHELARLKTVDINKYNPTKLDTDQWLKAAKEMGAKYAMVTASHQNGFLQWQTDIYPYSVKQAPWRNGEGDLVEDFVNSCRKYDIEPGIYMGSRFNAYRNVYQHLVNGGEGPVDSEEQEKYNREVEQMVEELTSRYGDLIKFWFDGGVLSPEKGGPDVLPIVMEHQPDILYYHSEQRADARWVGNEDGVTCYPCYSTITPKDDWYMSDYNISCTGDPDGSTWISPMADAPLRDHDWLWKPNREDKIEPLDSLIHMYYNSVGRAATLIIGITPDTSGLVPDADLKRMQEFGAELKRRFGNPVATARGEGKSIVIELDEPAIIDQLSIMEDIEHGERVRGYIFEGFSEGEWIELASGTAIGHKRIQIFDPVKVEKVRLRITESVANPVIKELAVYNIGK
ncbi:MAG: alpha-L-fucosidase [bacterium]